MKNKATKPGNQDFHISVGVQPTDDLNLDRELRMVKAAILYADKVKLYSLKVPSILAISRFNNFPLNLRLEFLERVIPYFSSKDSARKLSTSLNDYKKIMHKEKLDIHELQLKNEFEKKLEQEWEGIVEQTNKFVQGSQVNQINSAIKAGVLELHEFANSDNDSAALDFMIESAAATSELKATGNVPKLGQDQAWIGEFVENISNSVSDDSTYPLLDDATGNLVAADIRSKGAERKLFPPPSFCLIIGICFLVFSRLYRIFFFFDHRPDQSADPPQCRPSGKQIQQKYCEGLFFMPGNSNDCR